MDFEKILQDQLLSKTNIDYLIQLILTNFKISNKAINKCISIIKSYMYGYLQNLERYPENNNEVIDAIIYLNQKCFDDFTKYLLTKYSAENIYIQSAQWNGKPLNNCWIYRDELMKGGKLVFVMGKEPNINWGSKVPPPSIQ